MNPQQILDKLIKKWNQLVAKAQLLLEAFNRGLRKVARVAGWIAEKAANFWNDKVIPKWQEALDWMNKHLNVMGAPWLCSSLASQWREDVGQPVSARSGLATRGQLDVDTTWQGSAAQTYVDRLSQQEKAIAGVSTQFAEVIASALSKVGGAIIAWWVAIVLGVGTLIITLALATGEAVSIFGLPAVPPTVLLGWAALIASLITGTSILLGACNDAKDSLNGVRSKLSDYPAGAWPTFG